MKRLIAIVIGAIWVLIILALFLDEQEIAKMLVVSLAGVLPEMVKMIKEEIAKRW